MKTLNVDNNVVTAPGLQVLTWLCAISLFSCQQRTDQTALKASIEEIGTNWMRALEQGDVDAVAAMYTDDAYILPPNMTALQGRDGVKTYFSNALNAGIRSIRLVTEEVEGDDEAAVEKGTYQALADGGVTVDQGKYLVYWKKRDGKWMFHRDIFNSDMAAASAPAVAKGNVIGLHVASMKLKPGISREQFMEYYKNTVLGEYAKRWPEVKSFLIKGIRGEKKNSFGVMYVFESEAVRNKFFNEDGSPTADGQAVFQGMQPTFDRLEQEFGTATTVYTDWVVQ